LSFIKRSSFHSTQSIDFYAGHRKTKIERPYHRQGRENRRNETLPPSSSLVACSAHVDRGGVEPAARRFKQRGGLPRVRRFAVGGTRASRRSDTTSMQHRSSPNRIARERSPMGSSIS